MAAVFRTVLNNKNQLKTHIFTFIRHGHHLRGKAPGVAKSINQRLNEIAFKDPKLHFRVDIGFPQKSISRSDVLHQRLQQIKENRKNAQLEQSARQKSLVIDLQETNAEWLETCGPYQIKKIADHYAIYEHLYGDAYFIPRKVLNVSFGGETASPVLFGNVIKPSEARQPPVVSYDGDGLYTLVMTNLDGHLTEDDSEYVHWMIGNIPGNQIDKGELIIDYLQPFPPRGTGFHRHVFVLYKQTNLVNYSDLQQPSPCLNLENRTFSTLNFYKTRQNDLTPCALAFFQSDWDATLTDFYHNTLNMREPVFEYDFEPAYIRPQEWFPLRKPFNLYMDKYKDPKEVSERYFKQKLKDVHPFEDWRSKVPFPNAEPLDRSVPSWLKLEMKKRRMGWGRINDV